MLLSYVGCEESNRLYGYAASHDLVVIDLDRPISALTGDYSILFLDCSTRQLMDGSTVVASRMGAQKLRELGG